MTYCKMQMLQKQKTSSIPQLEQDFSSDPTVTRLWDGRPRESEFNSKQGQQMFLFFLGDQL